jgi:hypothetical protein
MATRVYIASVGSPSRWCINAVWTHAASEMSRLVARVRTIYPYRLAVGCRARPDVT